MARIACQTFELSKDNEIQNGGQLSFLSKMCSFVYAPANNIELHWNALDNIVLMRMACVYILFGAISAVINSTVPLEDISAMDLHMFMSMSLYMSYFSPYAAWTV